MAWTLLLFAVSASAQGGPGGATPPPPEVSYIVTESRSLAIEYEFLGVTAPSRVVEVRARVRGFIQERFFEEGAKVRKGDPLYSIDKASFEADVQVERARVEQAKARFELAQRELARLETLNRSGAIAQGDYDKAFSEFRSAQATQRLAEADLQKAQLELGYTDIAASINGLIGKTLKDVGSLVDSGENSLLTTITQISPIYASLRMSETDYLKWQRDIASRRIIRDAPGQEERFSLILPDGVVFPEEGKANFSDSSFDPSTGTFEIRAQFANKNEFLKAGQFVRVRVSGWERPNVVAVPQRSVFQSPAGPFVYVIGEGDKIGFRPVQAGDWAGSDWIIESGLKPGERVLVEGFLKARPGSPVTPVPYQPAEDQAQAANPSAGQEGGQ